MRVLVCERQASMSRDSHTYFCAHMAGIGGDVLKKRIAIWLNRGFIREASRSPAGEITYEAPSALGNDARQASVGR